MYRKGEGRSNGQGTSFQMEMRAQEAICGAVPSTLLGRRRGAGQHAVFRVEKQLLTLQMDAQWAVSGTLTQARAYFQASAQTPQLEAKQLVGPMTHTIFWHFGTHLGNTFMG